MIQRETGMDAAGKRQALKSRLARDEILVAPGIYDMISVRMAEQVGFECLYMTGFGTVASHLGEPDAGLATYSDMVDRVAAFCGGSRVPMICDGDTGYGGLLNVAHTVRGYERAGAAAIQLEDQTFPKKCGHTPGKQVIAAAEMADKIAVAVESRTDPDFLIVARTDARAIHGLDDALRRMEQYRAAGADILFIEAPESVDEMRTIGTHFDAPLLVNIVEGGKTPRLPAAELQVLGFRVAIHPAAGFLAAAQALAAVYGRIRDSGSTIGADEALYGFPAMCDLMGFPAVWAFDRAHA